MSAATAAAIRARLQAAFSDAAIEIEDQSHHHAGDAGAAGGGGHYAVRIESRAFAGLNRMQRHRRVYAAVAELMPREIHALAIEARAPDEPAG